ncbi:hypothetical protein HMI96_000734 [Salmonella enterica]|nr:hypothetical protein [Salmonella enterica]
MLFAYLICVPVELTPLLIFSTYFPTIRPSDHPTIRPSDHPTIRPSDHPTILNIGQIFLHTTLTPVSYWFPLEAFG